ncbi:MAG: excinuclease ABC subunit UvrA, partial [Bdellovibrionales bacterium]
VREEMGNRVADSIETALHLADGIMHVEDIKSGETHVFSAKFACPVSGFTIDEIEPRLFSFNSPHGACPVCDGLGEKLVFDEDLVVPNKDLSILEGAIKAWGNHNGAFYGEALAALTRHFKEKTTTPWKDLSEECRHAIIHGTGDEEITFVFDNGARRSQTTKPFEGVLPNLARRWRDTESNWRREDLSKYQSALPCEACNGKRLCPEALAVKIEGLDISELTALSIREAGTWFKVLAQKLSAKDKKIAARILKEINERLGFLNNVGLPYLSLSRSSGTLSGGESQRIRLASQIGSGLTGVLYVLDEPSIGLHQRDNDRLLTTLKHLRDTGNTVLVVEHDEDAIRSADYVIDMGPQAGRHGGEVVAAGTPKQIMQHPESLTGQYLTGKKIIPIPTKRRPIKRGHHLELIGARANNLKNLHVKFPLGVFTCVTGVSGGGKSTLVLETLYKALAQKLNNSRVVAGAHDELKGIDKIDKIVDIDQSPIGRTPRSNPATYTGAFTPIRDWFAGLPEAKARGYGVGRFSFNVKGGRCEACSGDGVMKIEMHFLPDVYVTCEQCNGRRYNRETLEITYKGKSIADVLDMTVEEGARFFSAVPSIRSKLEMLEEVGLGYIHIGQAATTLSGGEAQRVKLAKELARRATGKTLYILDEPTTGLHFDDVKKLLEVLHRLVDQGNSMIVIEHNLDVIKTADHIIDLGPEGGEEGGHIVATGTPEEIMKNKNSFTGKYLRK